MVGDIAHVCNRGVEKRKIFNDSHEYQRFVDSLFLLNNRKGKIRTVKDIFNQNNILRQEKLVEILKWSLLPNHYHLLLYESVDGGVLEFTKRLGNSFTKYFNIKNKGRSGYVFQNRAKIIRLENNAQYNYIPYYIDANSLSLIFPNRKNISIKNNKKALNFLKTYKWSSFKDYFGKGGMEIVINKDLFYKLFDVGPHTYEKELLNLSTCEVDKF